MTTETDTLTASERYRLSRLVGRPLRSWEWTGRPRRDETGTYSPAIAECGACGGKWDDALTTGITPTPAARCPFEDEHEHDEDPALTDHDALDQIAEVLRDCDWSEVLYDEDALDAIHGILVNAGRDPGPGVDDGPGGEPLTDRERRWRDLLAEYDGVRSDDWGPNDNALGRDDDPPEKPVVLIETNVRGSDPPYWLTTWANVHDAASYHVSQEYAEDWDASTLIDLDTGTLYAIETTATALPIP